MVTIDSGTIRGLERASGFAFLGVPYAAPPVGALRLLAPAPVERWTGVRDATRFGPTAPQPAQGFTLIPEPIVEGDACLDPDAWLSLNVFTPDLDAVGLPVLVYIHGGGYTQGTASSSFYDGRSFNRDGVVVVSVGYRLGAEGFLDLEGAPKNRAVLDWIAALEWVQANIARFGGDPGRVTIAGQSAGGGACAVLSTIPRANGLFQRAIPMSGSAFAPAPAGYSHAKTAAVAAKLGVAPTREAFAALTPAALVAAQAAAPDEADMQNRMLGYGPAVDGELILAPVIEAARAGAGRDIAMLVGATIEEFNAMFRSNELDDDTLVLRLAKMGMDADDARALRAARPDVPAGEILGQAMTDTTFRVPGIRLAETRAADDAPGAAPTFSYDVRWRSPGLGGIGAVHCVDVPFIWDVLDADGVTALCGDAPPQAMADAMHGAWMAFITNGDPGWPAYDLDRRQTMIFGTTQDGACAPVDDALHAERTTWR